ncbi:nucleoside phosphorylase domain-containing protein [Ilyonectria destructans]|nr:nucleoside phosphorylase domain-containing protein [Ilyonectria destructans]
MIDLKSQHTRSHNDYNIAVVCAMTFEMSALRYMLDQEHPRLPTKEGDPNIYTLGELHGHHVVLASLPGTQGKGSAATVATNLARTFPCIKWRFLVGIGGGVPSKKHDIRLGDVVVSMPEGQYGGVVQYDLGKDTEEDFHLKGFLMAPPSSLRSAVETMRSDLMVKESRIDEFISAMMKKGRRLAAYARPSDEADILFDAGYSHESNVSSCDQCDRSRCVERPTRDFHDPEIHYGLIASGDSVVKSPTRRNAIIREVGDVLCFEMEAAGIMTEFPGIVICGISDYADSHKNDRWHYYAAATAAACAKEVLSYLDPEEVKSSRLPSDHESRASNVFKGNGIQHTGSGSFSVGKNLNIS